MGTSGPKALLKELAQLERLRDPARCEGKRQFQRFVVRGDAELYPMDRAHRDQAPIPVMLRDLGRGGVGFVCQEPLEPQSLYQICFLQRGFAVGEQGLIVRHCERVQDNLYLIGGQFCIGSGLMCLLGVDPAAIREGDAPTAISRSATYLSPSEVA